MEKIYQRLNCNKCSRNTYSEDSLCFLETNLVEIVYWINTFELVVATLMGANFTDKSGCLPVTRTSPWTLNVGFLKNHSERV